jgi:hypothetical protein
MRGERVRTCSACSPVFEGEAKVVKRKYLDTIEMDQRFFGTPQRSGAVTR